MKFLNEEWKLKSGEKNQNDQKTIYGNRWKWKIWRETTEKGSSIHDILFINSIII